MTLLLLLIIAVVKFYDYTSLVKTQATATLYLRRQKTIAKPYFEKYQNLESIDDILNNPPFEYSPANAGIGLDERCMKGLIVARLVDNPKYEQLVSTYDEAIKRTMNTESIENYYKVREFLMYNRVK